MKFPTDDLNFLRELAHDVVEASRVRPNQRIGNSPTNTTGATLIRPGGRDCYAAMWVRDFVMSLDSKLISDDEIRHHFAVIKRSQNGATERRLKTGATVPPHAIPDHVNFDGGAVFYPGTMSAGDDQGGEPYGTLPPADDHYYIIDLGHRLRQSDDALIAAFDAVPGDPSVGELVVATPEQRCVGFGFCDGIYLTGSLLFPSLLRHRAARQLAALFPAREKDFFRVAGAIQQHVPLIFADADKIGGWLYAATDVGRQPDVWGTLFALQLGILRGEPLTRARKTIADAVQRGTITCQGAVRHIPTDFDASKQSAWQKTANVPLNHYQNGGYWHTPTGWLISALLPDHPELAEKVFDDYVAHLRARDFRKGEKFGAPWECFHPQANHYQNAVYMCSVTTPLGVIESLQP